MTDSDLFLEKIRKITESKFTPEYFEQLAKDSYKSDREYPENFSNWYPHILDFGYFKHADIISNQIFTFEEVQKLQKTDIIKDVNWNDIIEILKPTIDKMERYKLYSIKNGCFSNKFEFKTSISNKYELAEQFWKINYQSACFDTGGHTEIVVRDMIPNTIDNTYPTIYDGMPLREEVRVFYNMNKNQIEYSVDYWDYDYCAPNIRDKSDKIVFDWFHNKIEGRVESHLTELLKLYDRIYKNIHTLKFDDTLKGIWSIDFLYNKATDEIYLIDMARGFRSAYWNPDKVINKEDI